MLIGIGGHAFVGKDSFADAIVKGFGWRKTYMSAKLEESLLALNPIVCWWLEDSHGEGVTSIHTVLRIKRYRELHAEVGYDESKKHPEVRRLLQALGTEVGRDIIDKNLWRDLVFDEVDEWLEAGDSAAITGIRFRNELESIKERQGFTVWVHRPGYGPANNHIGETILKPDDFDYQVANNGSLVELGERACEMVAWLGATARTA